MLFTRIVLTMDNLPPHRPLIKITVFLRVDLAPPSCQTKSSGKPEISPQEFSHLQQQLQDMKEQVRYFSYTYSRPLFV